MKIAFVVQRYGLEVNGGAELHCRLVAEKLTTYCDVDVITTCAVDCVTWKNEYSPCKEFLNNVRVIRFQVDYERDIKKYEAKSWKVFGGASYEEEIEWIKMQGPYSSQLQEYLIVHEKEYLVVFFFTYLYSTTFFGLPDVKDKAVLVPTVHDEPPVYLSIFKDLFHMPEVILYNTPEEKFFCNNLFRNDEVNSDIVGVGIESSGFQVSDYFVRKYGFDNFILNSRTFRRIY